MIKAERLQSYSLKSNHDCTGLATEGSVIDFDLSWVTLELNVSRNNRYISL